MDEAKVRDDYTQQQEELANRRGRSWSNHECKLILMLVIGIILHYGETPTQALHTVSTLIQRSYFSLHKLWKHWRDEQEVYVVDTAGRGGGAPTHVNHTRHVTVEVVFTLIECIRKHNKEGGGCTTNNLIDALGEEHDVVFCLENLNTAVDHPGVPFARAADRGLAVAELRDPRTASWRGKLAADHFHPNELGYAAIAEVLGDAVVSAARAA